MLVMIAALMMMPADSPAITFQKVVHKHGGTFLEFQVQNPNKQDIHVVGYTPESYTDGIPTGEIRPIYQVQIRQGAGEWKKLELGHCGTGRGNIPIAAQTKVICNIVIPEGEWTEFRTGLAWTIDPKQQGSVAWSQPVKRESIQPKKP